MSTTANTISGFYFLVFCSWSEEGYVDDRIGDAVYCCDVGDARYLEGYFNHFYEQAGIGIVTSDDKAVSGPALGALSLFLDQALEELEVQPATWPVTCGYTDESMRNPIIEYASRDRLVAFLAAVKSEVVRAIDSNCFLLWCGGE